jgi:hypothetical protein
MEEKEGNNKAGGETGQPPTERIFTSPWLSNGEEEPPEPLRRNSTAVDPKQPSVQKSD